MPDICQEHTRSLSVRLCNVNYLVLTFWLLYFQFYLKFLNLHYFEFNVNSYMNKKQ